jgi:spore germination protein KB
MVDNAISDKEGLSLMLMFMIGTASVIDPGIGIAGRDMWLAVIISTIMTMPVALLCARLHYILPGKDLFDILEFCYGKFLGRCISLLYWWFFFHAALLVSMDITEYIKIVSFEATPYTILNGSIVFLGVCAVREGLVVTGRWAKFFIKPMIFLIFMTLIFLIPQMDIENLTPVLYKGFQPIFDGAFVMFSFPLAQLIPFVGVFGNLKTKTSSYKIYVPGAIIAGIVLLVVSLSNMLILGPHIASTLYFPSHDAIKRLHIGTVVQRIEIIANGVFVLGGFIMFFIYLSACTKAITKSFGFKDHKFMAVPIGLLIITFSRFLNEGFIDHLMFVKTWSLYSFPFLVIFPTIFLITAEIKIRRQQK